MGFLFGEGTPWTYEQLQRKRALAESMAAGIGSPSNVGEGLSAIGKALAARGLDRRADKREGELKAEADKAWSSVFSALTGRSAPVGGQQTYAAPTPAVRARTEADVIGDDAMAALGRPPVVSPEERDLLARTIQAEAGNQGPAGMLAVGSVIDNRRRAGEFGGNTFRDVIMAPGQFSAWNSVTGYAGGEQGQNMNFRPNDQAYAAADAILSGEYQSPVGDATHYFNPTISQPKWAQGTEWMPLGDHVFGSTTAPGSGGRAGVSGGVSASRMGADINQLQAVAEALGNPYIAQDPGKAMVLQALMQRALTPPQPGYQIASGSQLGFGGEMAGAMFNVSPDGRVTQIGGGGTNVTVNNAGEPQPQMGAIPQGYVAVQDPNSPAGYTMMPIPGGPEDTSASEAEKASAASTASDVITTAASRAREAAGKRDFGSAGTTAVAGLPIIGPMTDSAEVVRQVDALKSIASAEALNAMRRQSPTGGALGNVTEKELKLLSEQGGALDPNSPNFIRDLEDYERALLRTIHGKDAGDIIFEQTRQQPANNAGDVPVWNPDKGVWE